MDEDGNIRFSNRYFTASVPVRIYPAPHMQNRMGDDSFCHALRSSPAVAVVAAHDSDASVSTSKDIWGQLSKQCSDSATRILFLDGTTLSEEDTYQLIDWAQQRGVEVVSRFICDEDGITPAMRIERALECAKWPHTDLKQPHDAPYQEAKSSLLDDDGTASVGSQDDVLQPTRIRRGLDSVDVSRLVSDLLLDDETDSDSST